LPIARAFLRKISPIFDIYRRGNVPALDSGSLNNVIQQALDSFNEKPHNLVVSAHRTRPPSSMQSLILVLEHGRIIGEGTHTELFTTTRTHMPAAAQSIAYKLKFSFAP
jgi:ABC-type multidrug transport system fused ATPase/permease subunit